MADWLLPILFAVFTWWFSTGVVILLDGLPHRTFRWSLVLSSALGAAALFGLAHTASDSSVPAAYCAYTCALLLWGWHELSFLTGWITGPRKRGHSAGISRWRHAWQAVQVILWHELWLLLSLSLLAALTWKQPNQTGLWTFAVLWCMRASAKLNLFLGVRNLGLEFLPGHLSYLRHYFRQAAMNPLFPISVSLSTGLVVWLLQSATLRPGPASTGLVLVATILALGVLEHWMLVLPLSPSTLWRWALRSEHGKQPLGASPPSASSPDIEPTLRDGIDASGNSASMARHEELLHPRSA